MKQLPGCLLVPALCHFFGAAAQVNDTTVHITRDYLAYAYRYYEGEATGAGKFFNVISSRQAKIIIPESTRGEKKYRITDEGAFEYYYTGESGAFLRPMSQRTFYLETSRHGILSPGISYADFMAMTVAEKQAALASGSGSAPPRVVSGKLYDATVRYAATHEGLKVLVSRGTWKAELKPYDEKAEDLSFMFVCLLPHRIKVPRVVENFLTPEHEAKITSLDEFNELLDFMRQAGEVTGGMK